MHIQLTPKWLALPPIMTDPAIGVVRRPRSLVAHLPDRVAQWAIAQGLAIAPGDTAVAAPAPETAQETANPTDDLALDFANNGDEDAIAGIWGISDKKATEIVAARPLTLDALKGLLTSRQWQMLCRYVEGSDED